MFRFNKGFNITIIVLSTLIVTATSVLISVFPNKFEFIFGTGTFVFVSLGMFVSLQSLDTATAARADSEKSADATVASAESAHKALQLAVEEAVRAKERYRVENSSLLKLHKAKIHLPLIAPFINYDWLDSSDVHSKNNYDSILLRNIGIGTASEIDVDVDFINAQEFHNFQFKMKRKSTVEKTPGIHQIFPQYEIKIRLGDTESFPNQMFVMRDANLEEQGKYAKKEKRLSTKWYKPRRIGAQEKGDTFIIRLPASYRMLARQFFLERFMLNKKDVWVTPNPRLRVSVTYTEEMLEHMNDREEARRLKVFEISCNDDVRVAMLEEETKFGRRFLKCDFSIQTMFDRPLSAIMAEEMIVQSTGQKGK